jgi:hypothetical protein
VPEREREYPDAARFRNLPAHGLYCRHVTGLRVERTTLTVDEPDPRPALILDDVRNATVKSLVATAPSEGGPVAWLRSSRDCLLEGVRSREAETLARLSGPETARVRVVGGANGAAPQVVLVDADVAPAALRTQGAVLSKSPSEGPRAAGAKPGRPARPAD